MLKLIQSQELLLWNPIIQMCKFIEQTAGVL